MNRRIKFFLIFCFLVKAGYCGMQWYSPEGEPEAEPILNLMSNSLNGCVIQVEVKGFYFEETIVQGEEFQRIRLRSGFEPTSLEIGAPELPAIGTMIDVPAKATVKWKILEDNFADTDGFRPYPYQIPERDDGTNLQFSFNPSAYHNSNPFPAEAVEMGEVGVWREVQIVGMRIFPLQYIASEGKLRIHRRMLIEIKFEPESAPDFLKPPDKTPPVYERMYKKAILNYEPRFHPPGPTEEVVGTKYLIIAPESAVDIIAPLANFRHAQGFRTEIMTLSPLFQVPIDFKMAIQDLYLSDGLEYVLMVGDPNITAPVTPMYYWDYDPSNASYSDSWYTCVVPGGDSDHFPELAIGRLVYDNITELERQVNKTLDYLTNYDNSEDWFQNSLLVAHQEEYPLKYTQCKEQIRTYNYSLQVPNFTTIYGGAGGTNLDILNYVNSSSCGLFNYRGHGSETAWTLWTSWTNFTSTQVNAMTNQGRLFVLFDICCSNNNVVTFSGDCLCETFMQAENGAVAIHGAINPSYTEPNHIFDQELYKAVFDDGITNIGNASNTASVIVNNQFGSLGQANFRMYFWQGDPAIDLWTHIPGEAEVEGPERINLGQNSVEVSVSVGGNAFPQAMVCLQNDEIYGVGFTGDDGLAIVELDPLPLIPGDVYLTVSGHNLAFYQDTLSIGGGTGNLEGLVLSHQTGQPLCGASVSVPYLGYETIADTVGHYEFTAIPALTYEIIVQMAGYIDSVQIVTIDSGATSVLDFPLLHSECIPEVEEILVIVAPGCSADYSFNISNPGDGALEYNLEITGENSGANLYQWFYFNASSQSGDYNIQGVAFDGEIFWVTGSGDELNNWIHKFDQRGNFLESLPQPQTSTNHGFYDLCWDGEYFYSAENSDIICFDTSANYIRTIPTTLNPVKAIAYNPDSEHFFIGSGIYNIREIDSLGTIINTFGHNHNISGLGWWGEDEDGYPLYIFSQGPPINIYKMNPCTGAEMLVGNILGMPGDSSGGCWITETLNPLYVLFLGVVQGTSADKIKGWQLQEQFNWVTVAPTAGTVPPNSGQLFQMLFDASALAESTYIANIMIEHNGFGGLCEIPVTMIITSSRTDPGFTGLNAPLEYGLKCNRPNPFNEATVIEFTLPEIADVELEIFNILGREIESARWRGMEAGIYQYKFEGKGKGSGIYFCRLRAGDFTKVEKMVFLK